MPRYFFHVRDGQDFIRDPEGANLPDVTSAVREARSAVREIVADRVRKGVSASPPIIEIHDHDGRKVTEFSFTTSAEINAS